LYEIPSSLALLPREKGNRTLPNEMGIKALSLGRGFG